MESRLEALEKHNTQLKEREMEKMRENETKQKKRDGQEREKEMRWSRLLEQKDGDLIEIKSRIEELMRDKERISLLVEERDKDVEQLQTMLSTEKRTHELRLKEVKEMS